MKNLNQHEIRFLRKITAAVFMAQLDKIPNIQIIECLENYAAGMRHYEKNQLTLMDTRQ